MQQMDCINNKANTSKALDALGETITVLSDMRSRYNCFDPGEEKYYRALSHAIQALSNKPDITEEQVKEYCRRRCLTVIDNLLLHKYVSAYEGNLQPNLQPTCNHLATDFERRSLNMDKLPSVQPSPQWIPCSERLPSCNGCYLVWRPHFFGGEIGMPAICYFDGSDKWHDSYGVDFERVLHSDDVTAWMPLPEPYGGEQE